MRYSLFENKEQADSFAKEVEAEINATPESIRAAHEAIGETGDSPFVKIAVWIEHLRRYVVSMEVEPATLRGEIVDTIAQPVIDEQP